MGYLSLTAEGAFYECTTALKVFEAKPLLEITKAEIDMRTILRAITGMKEVMDTGRRVWALGDARGTMGLDACMGEAYQRIEKLMKYTNNKVESELTKDPRGGPAREAQRRAILEFKAIDRLKDFDNERQEYKT